MKSSLIWITAMVIILAMVAIMQMTNKKMATQKESWGQFECGFNLMTPSHMPFSFQFFLVALLFLIFDVEIALVLSFPLEKSITKNVMFLTMFIAILTLGLLYEWQKGKIMWSKWMG